MTEPQYVYQKERKEFGRQCLFADKKYLMVSIASEHSEFNNYILRNPVSEGTQLGKQYALTEVNTVSTTTESRGIMHTEGGWPKDVNFQDAEQTLRYRRKLEKDETYITQVPRMGEKVEFCILQNNAVNIYEEYFADLDPAPIVDRCHSRTMYVYKDVEEPSRPISHLSWSCDGGSKLAITYCDTNFQKRTSGVSFNSYIWETENPNQPLYKISPSGPSICIEYHNKDPYLLVSGQQNGQCCAFDTRSGPNPVFCTPREVSHRESVNSVLWINSKTHTECFSGGADGQVVWWDIRRFNERLDVLYMDPMKTDDQSLDRAYGVSVLEYETTIPTRFMVGTEQGMLFFCNRKGKTPMEKIPLRMQCHASPIYTLARNPSFFKNFITVGDWNARIWSEDCKESSIIWTKYCNVELTGGCWSPTKCSLFYLSRMDGNVEAWDLLQQQSEPVLTIKVSDHAIRCLKPHESGKMVACGSANGFVHLMEVSENMSFSAKNDKAILNAMLDRESKREKILEGKLREIKIKLKKQLELQDAKVSDLLQLQAEMPPEETKVYDDLPKIKPELVAQLIDTANKEFFSMIEEETQRRIKAVQNEASSGKKSLKTKKKHDGSSTEIHQNQSSERLDEEVTNGHNDEHENKNQMNGNAATTTNGHVNENGHTNGHDDADDEQQKQEQE
ncbi:hypothetical protein PVAND_001532 [Polypedilum vanderplanki]|uniref:Dynein intermediate chain 3, ciliary n=1 Tax=Polypedilum vanderplanki TaxID=319348 RepID=A0A9J6BN79_POLVA|nr:hypothetical protein PVAND_001532 [Polypedilum vanderplanki]